MTDDVGAERMVLGGIYQFGGNAFVDVDDLIDLEDFTDVQHQYIYATFKDFYKDQTDKKLDIPTIISIAKKLGFKEQLEIKYVRAVTAAGKLLEEDTVRREAGKLFRLSTGRELRQILSKSERDISLITGDETLDGIITLAEAPIFDFTSKLNNLEQGTIHIAKGGHEWLDNLIAHPMENIGIPTPWSRYNELIGGGYRRKTVSVIGGRQKSGKTFSCDTICLHVAGTLHTPVFNPDTEMDQHQHLARILAHLTGIPTKQIERGQLNKSEAGKIHTNIDWLETIPYFYECVADKPFEEHISTMRRWVIKNVGVDHEGKRNNALIVYDYLHLADPDEFKGDFKEHQMLGFQMVALNRLMHRCDVAGLTFVQIGRQGIKEFNSAAIADSDRIGRKCANFALLRKKNEVELAESGQHGQLALHVILARHGEGSEEGDYINMKFEGAIASLTEGKTRFEVEKEQPHENKGFITDIPDDEVFHPKSLPGSSSVK